MAIAGRRRRVVAVAGVAALACAGAGCGSGTPEEGAAKAVALRALGAYDTGDVKTLCELTPAAKRAQFRRGTTCRSFYTALFVQQSGHDAIDQAMRPPFRPGSVTGVRRVGDRTIVTVAPRAIRLTAFQRRGVRLRYGPDAIALKPPRLFPVTVTEENGRLVAGF
ncbi:MAG: hypothetical protein JWN65_549 [Solirubrobacterales bacterium]|nr:hypothetical protein [Solirubrobacterales bacterium]